jgi:hypothetical protein
MNDQTHPSDYVAIIIGWLGILSILGAPVVLALQVLIWLARGFWMPFHPLDIFVHYSRSPPYFSWLGVQKIWEYILTSEIYIVMFLSGLVLFILHFMIDRFVRKFRAGMARTSGDNRT